MAHSLETRQKISAGIKRAMKEGRRERGIKVGKDNLRRHRDIASQRRRALTRLSLEAGAEATMVAAGYEVFKLPIVCDRIAVKDGKVYFVEFKRHGREELRPGQQRIHDLVPEMYLVIEYNEGS